MMRAIPRAFRHGRRPARRPPRPSRAPGFNSKDSMRRRNSAPASLPPSSCAFAASTSARRSTATGDCGSAPEGAGIPGLAALRARAPSLPDFFEEETEKGATIRDQKKAASGVGSPGHGVDQDGDGNEVPAPGEQGRQVQTPSHIPLRFTLSPLPCSDENLTRFCSSSEILARASSPPPHFDATSGDMLEPALPSGSIMAWNR